MLASIRDCIVREIFVVYPLTPPTLQAIGRLIRNTEDYGVLVLLDKRYASKSLRQLLPSWVRQAHRQWHVRDAAELAPGFDEIGRFFRDKVAERDAGIDVLD